MTTGRRPSLRGFSLFSLTWFTTVLAGWALLVRAIAVVSTASLSTAGAPFAMMAALLVLLELLPLVRGRGQDRHGVVMSTAFVCAMLMLWGIWPAVVVASVAALASDINRGNPVWKVLFDVGHYTISVAAGWLVMVATGHTPTLERPLSALDGRDLLWIAGVWAAYFVTNDVLVSGVLAWSDSFLRVLLDDFRHYTAMTAAVLALSPVVVLVAQSAWVLMPLLLIPLLLVYRTAQLSLEKEHQAHHDSLTGLPNRTQLMQSLQVALTRCRRDSRPMGLLLIDLDHFKEVNDTLGHHVGDQLLVQFAHRLTASTRDGDLVARLGGDEFAVIVPESDPDAVRQIAERIRAALTVPLALYGMTFDVEASIGYALHPEHADQPTDLLRLADVAMYDAKQHRAGIAVYSADRDHNSPDRLVLLGELRQALADHALDLHYQPKVSLRDGAVLGVEALVRWNHPQRGWIVPEDFVPLAERCGIMPELTARVIDIALRQLASWRTEHLDVPVAVNVSVADLVGGRLATVLAEGLRTHRVPPGMVQLELTERVVADDSDDVEAVLRPLADLGVALSLDDFGTGYSSLQRLQTIAVDEIKIDRTFVSRLTHSKQATGIVRAVVDLSRALGVTSIAEGVESAEEWDLLRRLGCDGAQGWHIAAPMTAAATTEWLRGRLPQVGAPERASA